MIPYELITGESISTPKKGYIWCTDGTFVRPSNFKKLNKEAYGYAIDDNLVASLKKSEDRLTWKGANFYCLKQVNGGKVGASLPNKYEISQLYKSIMGGRMERELKEAGIYEECTYRMDNNPTKLYGQLLLASQWVTEWTSTSVGTNKALCLYYDGDVWEVIKDMEVHYAIPFFRFY